MSQRDQDSEQVGLGKQDGEEWSGVRIAAQRKLKQSI